MNLIKKYHVFVLLGILYTFTGYMLLMVFYPVKTLVINKAEVVTKVIHPGEVFVYKINYCKFTDKGALVYRTFHEVNERNIETFPSVETITKVGCASPKIPLQTYTSTPPGEYFLLVDVSFKVNPLRTEHVTFKTDNFIVK